MPQDPPMTVIEKRLIANGLAQAAIFSELLDLLIRKNLISFEEFREMLQEATLRFMQDNATEVERMAAEALLSFVRHHQT